MDQAKLQVYDIRGSVQSAWVKLFFQVGVMKIVSGQLGKSIQVGVMRSSVQSAWMERYIQVRGMRGSVQ